MHQDSLWAATRDHPQGVCSVTTAPVPRATAKEKWWAVAVGLSHEKFVAGAWEMVLPLSTRLPINLLVAVTDALSSAIRLPPRQPLVAQAPVDAIPRYQGGS